MLAQQIGKLTFHPIPGSPAWPLAIHGTRPWDALNESLVRDLGCASDDLHIEDIWWGEEGERATLITMNGEILGSVGRELTPEELTAVQAQRKVLL